MQKIKTLLLLVSNLNLLHSSWNSNRALSSDAACEWVAETTKKTLSTHPSQIITLTAKHPGMERWKPFRGTFIVSCLFQNEANLPLFQPPPAQRSGEGQKESESSALLKRLMISHTHSQARSLPDTTPLISRPENWRASHSWATAPGLAGPQGPTKPCVLPHPAMRKASWGRPRCNWLPRC